MHGGMLKSLFEVGRAQVTAFTMKFDFSSCGKFDGVVLHWHLMVNALKLCCIQHWILIVGTNAEYGVFLNSMDG